MDKDKFFIYAFTFLLALLFLIGLQKVYDRGVYDALKDVCGDLDIGVEFGKYVCYNASKSTTPMYGVQGWYNGT